MFFYKPKKLLFEHIPKCGGTTVKNFLISQYSKKKVFAIDGSNPDKSISYFKSLPERERYYYDLIVGHGAHKLRNHSHPETIKATIFRDPIERIISHYFYVLRSPRHYLHQEVTKNRLSLVSYATSSLSGELRNNFVARFLEITACQAEKNAEESIIRTYKLIREEYAVVGILEYLDPAINLLSKILNYQKKFNSMKLNATIDRMKLEEIDQTVIRAIKDINYLDVRLYKLIKRIAPKSSK